MNTIALDGTIYQLTEEENIFLWKLYKVATRSNSLEDKIGYNEYIQFLKDEKDSIGEIDDFYESL